MKDFKKKIEKKFGDSIFTNKDFIAGVIPTGSLSLDVSLGIGGIPKGRFTTIYGAESSGKTTLCLQLARNAIELGDCVLYIDAEQTLDLSYAESVIGDFSSSMLIVTPETAEDAMTIAEYGINGDEKLGISPGQFGLIIVDSLAALAPEKEKEKELTDSNVALVSRLLSAFFRRNADGVRKNNIAVVLVNQVRDNIGSYYGGYNLPGGHALKHYSSIILFLSSGEKIEQNKEIIGVVTKFIVKKNKLAPPFRQYYLSILFGKGIDTYRDVVDFASTMGIIDKKGSYFVYKNETLGQGMNKACAYLKDNPETLDKIRKECYTYINVGNVMKLDNEENEGSLLDE